MSDLISMNENISRKAILKELERIAEIHPYKVIGDRDSYSPYNEAWEDCISLVEERIQFLPSAEPERKRGEWKPFDLTWGRSIYSCTVCGEAIDIPTEKSKPIFSFCPHCGAEMR